LTNQKQGGAVRSHLLHSSLAAAQLFCPSPALANCEKMLGQKHFAKLK